MENKDNSRIGSVRYNQKERKRQIVIEESEGANPDSVKTILLENGKDEPIIEYRIDFHKTNGQREASET